MERTLSILFFSEWHISQCVGDGYKSDAVVMRDNDNFPYIPGRALKGVLREGAARLSACRKDLLGAELYFFGEKDESLATKQSGCIRVSSAHLPLYFKQGLMNEKNANYMAHLTTLHSQTFLTNEGNAKKGCLRTIECSLQGLELFADISVRCQNLSEEWLEAYFTSVCAAVKNIGSKKTRGMGRCKVSIQGHPMQTLPETTDFFSKWSR